MPIKKPTARRPKVPKNSYLTKSGQTIKLHRTITEKYQARKAARALRRAQRLAGLPKSRFKRILFRLHPKRVYRYWFSREGLIMALKITGFGIISGFVFLVAAFAYFRKDLPNLHDISGNNIGGSVLYYDRTGKTLLWEDVDGVKRIPVKSENMSPFIKQATVAVEDKDFFKHGGFDVRAIVRAAVVDIVGRGTKQGGSTITQQLVRLTQSGVGYEQKLTRKLKELIIAVELEREYTKEEILVGYLNAAPYGGIEYGVEAAARDYFHKSAKDLTLDEAALLAAIPKAPCYYSFYCKDGFNQKETEGRQDYILDQMFEQKMITSEQRDTAKKVNTIGKIQPRQSRYAGIKAPWFVLAARNELENKYSDTANRSGWKVITTLNLDLQKVAEDAITNNIPSLNAKTRGTADTQATVVEDVPTGQIVALVGGVDFSNADHGQNNYAAQILIPPGSSFKPYDYAALIENNKNVGAGSVLYDTQGPLPGYICTNKSSPKFNKQANCLWDYDFRFPGPMTLRYALGGSRNIPAVKAMLSAVPNDTSQGRVDSINKTISTASAMMANPYNPNAYNCYADEQLKTPTQCYGAAAIGDGAFLRLDDHVNGLATFGRLGNAIAKTYILKITDSANKSVFEFKQPQGKQVIKPDTAYILNDMASDYRASYLPGSCTEQNCRALSGFGYKFHRYNGWKFAIKTGTTNNGFDGLMTSWSSKYAVVSWVGNHFRNLDINRYGYSMEYFTAPITRPIMEAAHANLPANNWVQPAGVKSLPAFVVRNHVGIGSIEPSPTNDLYPAWYVQPNKSAGNQTIDIVSNKIATDCTPERARKNDKDANSNVYSADVFVGTSGAGDKDDVHKCEDVKPSIAIISAPSSCNGSCTINVQIAGGTHPINSDRFTGTANIVIDGQVISSHSVSSPGNISLNFTFNGSGNKNVQAQIIDSVLYEALSDSASINFEVPDSLEITGPSDGDSGVGTPINLFWTGGVGPFTVFSKKTSAGSYNVVGGCSNISDRECFSIVLSGAVGTKFNIKVEDDLGNSDVITIEK